MGANTRDAAPERLFDLLPSSNHTWSYSMSETKSLTALRSKLVVRRRQLVDSQASTPVEQLTGDPIARIQEAIDAVDRALADESAEEFRRRVL
jgi:hypothetical protein